MRGSSAGAPALRRPGRRWLLALPVGIGLVVAGVAFADAQSGTEPYGTDPLSPVEQAEALQAADLVVAGEDATGVVEVPEGEAGGGGADEPATAGAEGPEQVVLLVERHIEDKDAPDDLRRADVYVYDYADDTLTLSVVDLADGTVDESQQASGQQLPLVAEERNRALDLAFADPEVRATLEDLFAEVTGQALTDPAEQLQVDPIVFVARSAPDSAQGAAVQCGVHRCAQLLLRTHDNVLIDLLPIVDLSTGQVVSEDGFFS